MENKVYHPLAITMWDFSWIERNWIGSGFEDMNKALEELVERGYNAIRIDAFPHLIAEDKNKEWTLKPVWYANDWGSPYINRITLYPAIIELLRKCRNLKIKVGLSSWYREDIDDVRMKITTPEKMAENWIAVLDIIQQEGLLDAILYVDFCNEWPGDIWAPYFINNPKECTWGYWHTETSLNYMKRAIEIVRAKYNDIPLTFSFDGLQPEYFEKFDLSFFDFIEQHIWMTKLNNNEFYSMVGQVKDGRYTEEAYHLLSENALRIYYSEEDYWKKLLVNGIQSYAKSSEKAGLMLATTECWGIVDYKDYPLLPWDWVKELCELGVKTALNTNRWLIIATSNFACPQFAGMWNDVEWHKRLTNLIRSQEINPKFINNRLKKTLYYDIS